MVMVAGLASGDVPLASGQLSEALSSLLEPAVVQASDGLWIYHIFLDDRAQA